MARDRSMISGVHQTTPTGGTMSPISALADGALLSNVAIDYRRLTFQINAGASGYLQLHDVSAVPAEGATPVVSRYVSGGPGVSYEFRGAHFDNGCYWCLSSTQLTKTITAFTGVCVEVEV